MSDQTLNVKLTGDESDLVKATTNASKSLDNLKADVDKVDASSVEVPVKLELDRLNRDTANLNKVLDGIERRKANPDVDLDITQLLKDEARVRKQLDALDKRRVEIETEIAVEPGALARLSALTDDLDSSIGGLIPGLGNLTSATKGVGVAAGAAAAAYGAWQLGSLAGDVETTTMQLSALTGSVEDGAAAFELLQGFAASTPFELDQVTTAARSLIAAGVGLEDLPTFLTDLGNVASATGAPLEEIALVFQQMLSKGKVSNEEMLQLAERGVPAYQALADQLGVTVPEVQKLAEQGALGADKVGALARSLGDLYPTAMGDQAESFNGQMSTLLDNVKQIGQNIGAVFLPAMSDLVGAFNDVAGPAADATKSLADFTEAARGGDVEAGAPWYERLAGTLKDIDSIGFDDLFGLEDPEDMARRTEELENAGIELGTNLTKSFNDIADAVGNAGGNMSELEAAIADAASEGVEIRTRVNFLIDMDDLQDEITKATTGADAVQLPADLQVRDIGGLTDAQKQVLSDLSSFVQAGLEEGARRAKVDPRFDVNAWQDRVFAKAKKLLIQAGVDPSEAERVLKNFLGIRRTATIGTEVETQTAKAKLQALTAKAYVAEIIPFVDSSAAWAELGRLTAPDTKTITVNYSAKESIPGMGGGARSAPPPATAVPGATGLLGASRAMTTPSAYVPGYGVGGVAGGRVSPTSETRRLMPRQTPVAVYLDGAQIADYLSLRTDRLATVGSVRREA